MNHNGGFRDIDSHMDLVKRLEEERNPFGSIQTTSYNYCPKCGTELKG